MLLARYQQLLSDIHETHIAGYSLQELEKFRNEFATSMHTCRLRSCPRATVGFESQKLHEEHEMSHVRKRLYKCTNPACQYPPFPTPQALETHIELKHGTAPPRKSIRKVRALDPPVGTSIAPAPFAPKKDRLLEAEDCSGQRRPPIVVVDSRKSHQDPQMETEYKDQAPGSVGLSFQAVMESSSELLSKAPSNIPNAMQQASQPQLGRLPAPDPPGKNEPPLTPVSLLNLLLNIVKFEAFWHTLQLKLFTYTNSANSLLLLRGF